MLVKALKLISGEELIGEVLDEDYQVVNVRNLLAIMIQRTPTGDLNVGFIPFAPYLGKNTTFEFKREQLLFVKEVDDQMANQYNSIFGGIVTPTKQLIVG